jgi:hypothetical protein
VAPPTIHNREVFCLGVDYDEGGHESLPETVRDADRIAHFFQDLGFVPVAVAPHLPAASARTIVDAIERWADAIRADDRATSIVLYLGGHGRLHNGRHFILTRDSPVAGPYSASKAVSVDEVAAIILNSGAQEALLLLDVCRAGFAASEVQAALDRQAASTTGPSMRLAILVSCLHHERSYSGRFVETLIGALRDGSGAAGEQRHWRDLDPWVTPGELCDELRDRLSDEQCARVAGLSSIKLVPNPRYRVGAADRSVAIGTLLQGLSVDDREHFLLKASGADAADVGWFFAGRNEVNRSVLRWLDAHDQGTLVLTGSPGAGKSAVLGRLAVLADRRAQAVCRALGMLDVDPLTVPPVGLFDAVVHLKSKSADVVAQELAAQLGFDLSTSVDPITDLMLELTDSRRAVTVLADALDEAEPGEDVLIARDLLRAIADVSGCRLVVGTRRDRTGRHDQSVPGPGPLISALISRRVPSAVIDLDKDPATMDAIAHYVDQRLGEAWSDPQARLLASTEVARRSGGLFLYARFAVRALQQMPDSSVADGRWTDVIAAQAGTAGLFGVFAADIERFDDPLFFHETLRPLAFARGRGLPRRDIWPALATALATSGRAYSDSDIARTIREAGWYLIEGTENGQAVFRLYHQAIADYLRSEVTGWTGLENSN